MCIRDSREYVTQNEMLSVMRGKLDMSRTILNRIQHKQKLACEFDAVSYTHLEIRAAEGVKAHEHEDG